MNKKFDRLAAIIFLITGITFILESRSIAATAYGSVVGPNVFPFILGCALSLLSCRLFYETFSYKGKEQEAVQYNYKQFFIILASAILYALLLEKIGFIISSFLFLIVAIQTMERGNWIKSLSISLGYSLIIYFIFVDVLKGTLPVWSIWF
ncbi:MULTISPECIES: tripartite tricarboxylate transporter TctB family protein [Bacillaceae]|jgi:putative tricarboxylic transport membrane protein|uniref:Transporter n=1 Tax=Gottfriedia luciferensis TaxID=178774 RepID=A0ABX2ZTL7_9BACI|nr:MULTISPECIES: tripartite tricarboxylate transporter TctB family protein [Bacillaceae]ODG92893.1 transporter [Gottfriedia luciferensis]PGZ93150.1 tripartite tricarboxylate transporter TctB family protein [Bacillus sp. AFS029533]SFD35234.1 putative tricarboxylic transport membrane protein [Bacillus sp. UNCCL81]